MEEILLMLGLLVVAATGLVALILIRFSLSRIERALKNHTRRLEKLYKSDEQARHEMLGAILSKTYNTYDLLRDAVCLPREENARAARLEPEKPEEAASPQILEAEARDMDWQALVKEAETAGISSDIPMWLYPYHSVINMLLMKDDDSLLMEKLQLGGIPKQLVNFYDPLEYQRDTMYAVFSDSGNGYGFLIANPEDREVFALYPYRYGNRWLIDGVNMLEQVYYLEGNKKAYKAYVQVDTPAYLRQTGTKHSREGKLLRVFEPISKGTLRIIEK